MAPATPQDSVRYGGALDSAGLWQGFVWGFGGAVAAQGRFVLTTPETVAALRALVDLIQHYSVPADVVSALPAQASVIARQAEVDSLSAMAFSQYGTLLGAGFRWARLPRFPVRPVVPVTCLAEALYALGRSAPAAPDSPQALAAAQVAVWLNAPEGAHLEAAFGVPSASADPAVQSAFWSGSARGTAAVVGDWRNFRDAYAGYPVIPSKDYVRQAIPQVLAGKAALTDALARAQQEMNAELPYAQRPP